jgi:hypothetical protein
LSFIEFSYGGTVSAGVPFLTGYYALSDVVGSRVARWKKCTIPQLSWYHQVFIGGISAALSIAITTPVEYMRHRVITEWQHRETTMKIYKESGFIAMVKHVKGRCREELKAKLFRVAPRSAIKKATYGFFKTVLIRAVKRR